MTYKVVDVARVFPATLEEHLRAFDQTGLDPMYCRTLARLLDMAVDIPVRVGWSDLGPVRRGEYLDDDQLILLNTRLQAFQVTETLGHELVHAAYRDRASRPENEARARVLGAALVFDPGRVRGSLDGRNPDGYCTRSREVLQTAFDAVQRNAGLRRHYAW